MIWQLVFLSKILSSHSFVSESGMHSIVARSVGLNSTYTIYFGIDLSNLLIIFMTARIGHMGSYFEMPQTIARFTLFENGL